MKKILLVSSSGGHFEQLKMLRDLEKHYEVVWVTEKTKTVSSVDYKLMQNGLKDLFFIIKLIVNYMKTKRIMFKEKPDVIITTGTLISIPFGIIAKRMKIKLIYIETFARLEGGTRTGKLMYRKYADLFIVQWKKQLETYPNAIYGGSIY